MTQAAIIDPTNRRVRIDLIIHINAQCASGVMTDLVHEAFKDYFNQLVIMGAAGLPPQHTGMTSEQFVANLVAHGKRGFLIMAATPIPYFGSDLDKPSFDWMSYTVNWFYGETFNEAWAKAGDWSGEVLSMQRDLVSQARALRDNYMEIIRKEIGLEPATNKAPKLGN